MLPRLSSKNLQFHSKLSDYCLSKNSSKWLSIRESTFTYLHLFAEIVMYTTIFSRDNYDEQRENSYVDKGVDFRSLYVNQRQYHRHQKLDSDRYHLLKINIITHMLQRVECCPLSNWIWIRIMSRSNDLIWASKVNLKETNAFVNEISIIVNFRSKRAVIELKSDNVLRQSEIFLIFHFHSNLLTLSAHQSRKHESKKHPLWILEKTREKNKCQRENAPNSVDWNLSRTKALFLVSLKTESLFKTFFWFSFFQSCVSTFLRLKTLPSVEVRKISSFIPSRMKN